MDDTQGHKNLRVKFNYFFPDEPELYRTVLQLANACIGSEDKGNPKTLARFLASVGLQGVRGAVVTDDGNLCIEYLPIRKVTRFTATDTMRPRGPQGREVLQRGRDLAYIQLEKYTGAQTPEITSKSGLEDRMSDPLDLSVNRVLYSPRIEDRMSPKPGL